MLKVTSLVHFARLEWLKPCKFAVVVSIGQKTKIKKTEERQKQTEKQNLGVATRFSSKAKASSPSEDKIDWLIDWLCNRIEIKNNEMIQSFLVGRSWNQWFLLNKNFCTRRSRKKCFRRFDHKTNERKVL